MTCYLPSLLLVVLLFVSGGHSLNCYSCIMNTNNTACNVGGPTTCPLASQDTCATILFYQGSFYIVTKQCVSKAICDAAKEFEGITANEAKLSTTCCQSDGCNVNAAPRPVGAAHVTLALLGVAISVVVSRALV
ncbi:lymphocyte antigen 6E-like [Lethenteron reissneri]|uniref:lymphocyte antigen 6E-like n=1 Tax=Lethenteron reissneri TaxID=7753 RepID=UPI002AB7BBFF|nr:lymphocyte antigen 6E-like [Lethenteron reissneri]